MMPAASKPPKPLERIADALERIAAVLESLSEGETYLVVSAECTHVNNEGTFCSPGDKSTEQLGT